MVVFLRGKMKAAASEMLEPALHLALFDAQLLVGRRILCCALDTSSKMKMLALSCIVICVSDKECKPGACEIGMAGLHCCCHVLDSRVQYPYSQSSEHQIGGYRSTYLVRLGCQFGVPLSTKDYLRMQGTRLAS